MENQEITIKEEKMKIKNKNFEEKNKWLVDVEKPKSIKPQKMSKTVLNLTQRLDHMVPDNPYQVSPDDC